jgi:hypothetical protein
MIAAPTAASVPLAPGPVPPPVAGAAAGEAVPVDESVAKVDRPVGDASVAATPVGSGVQVDVVAAAVLAGLAVLAGVAVEEAPAVDAAQVVVGSAPVGEVLGLAVPEAMVAVADGVAAAATEPDGDPVSTSNPNAATRNAAPSATADPPSLRSVSQLVRRGSDKGPPLTQLVRQ